MKKEVILLLIVVIFLISCTVKDNYLPTLSQQTNVSTSQQTNNPSPSGSTSARVEQHHPGDLIISQGTYLINNSKFTLRGNLIVNGTGKLIVQDSDLYFEQDYNQQYRAYIKQRASLEMKNVHFHTNGKWFNFQYQDQAKAIFQGVSGEDCCIPWHGSSDDVHISIENSTIGLTVSDNVKVIAKNSNLFFELVLSNVTGTYALPSGYVEKYELIVPHKKSIIELSVTNSTFTDWGTTLDKYTNVTFINSTMTIGMNAGSDWANPRSRNAIVTVSEIRNKVYGDYTLTFDTNHLHLINTFVRDWYPQAFNNATIEIINSELADLQSNSGTANIIVRNSTMSIAIARENVTYIFYDSTIAQDAIAHDNAKIHLYNTNVLGQIKEIGNGKVFQSETKGLKISQKPLGETISSEEKGWRERVDKALLPSLCPSAEKIIYPDNYYQGPLIDTHLHIPAIPDWSSEEDDSPEQAPEGRFGGPQALLGWNIKMSEIACTLKREGTQKNFAFFPVYEGEMSLHLLEIWNKTMAQYPELFTPFIMSSGNDNEPEGFPTVAAKTLNEMLGVYPHLFQGYGEIGLYARENGGSPELPPDSRRMREIYPLIKKHNLVVYFHLGDGHKDNFETVLKENPDLTFIWHGDQLSVDEVGDILQKYPNANYGIDEFFGGEREIFELYVGKNKEEYLKTVATKFDQIIQQAVNHWQSLIEQHPEQVLWGTDRGDAEWNYDPEVGQMQVKIARAFIGKLDPAVQEKFAYKNAEKIFKGNEK